jgi:hypothetical protein
MRNRIFGAIGIIWGGGILISTLMRGGPQGRGSYAAGEYGGITFGALLLIAGIYTFFKPSKPNAS